MGTSARGRARSPHPLAVRTVVWLYAAALLAPAIAVPAAAQGPPGLAPEYAVGGGAWALVQAAGGNLSGETYFSGGGQLVYDTTLTVWVQGGQIGGPVPISVEQYVASTQTIRVWVPPGAQGSPGYWANETVPVALDPQWSNTTVQVPALEWTSAAVDLPPTPEWQTESLAVSVGGASWQLTHRTPTGAALAGEWTEGNVLAFALLEVLLTAWVVMLVLGAAYVAVRHRIHRAPRSVGDPLWTLAWILVPYVALNVDYVDVSQLLGTFSPYLIPAVAGVALFPWALHLFPDGERCGFVTHGLRNSTTGEHLSFGLNIWRWRDEAEVCPRTLREMWWVLLGAAAMPRLPATPVPVGEKEVPVGPRGIGLHQEPGFRGRS